MPEMTELEGTVLCLLALRPNSTAYEIRREFQKSGTAHWRASAGAIYPLLQRLGRKGLVSATAADDDRRGTRHLALTQAGLAAAHGWVVDDRAGLATAAPDPIRTRCHFLALLTGEQRGAMLECWIGQTERELAALRERDPFEDRYEQWAVEGAIGQLEARRAWLEAVAARLAEEQR
jgi:DNA-binding PadR family transcriptional regulator